jgi:hypothetical membrane protein
VAGLLSSITCVTILHTVRTDLSPLSHRLSEYAVGPYGWMMTAAFITLGCGVMALGIALWAEKRRDEGAWIFLAIALLAAVGTILSGVFRTGASDISEAIHSRASAIAVVAVVALALAYSVSLARRRPSAASDPVGAGLAVTAAALAVMSPVWHHTRWTGLSQRLLWIALITWLLRAAWERGPQLDEEAA